jgi:drug/metabolite transporter (DMT)-like permease
LTRTGAAILLTYLAIVFIVAWLWVRHGHRPTLLTMAGGVAALGGLVLMLDLSGGTTPRIGWAGVLWGLATAVASSREEDRLRKVLWNLYWRGSASVRERTPPRSSPASC